MINKIVELDVLSVGGSGAGVMSAIAAKRSGAKRVMVVSKGKIGQSGNAIMAGGGFSIDGESAYHELGIENANPSFTKDILFENIVKESYYMSDQNLAQQYVDDSPKVVQELLEWGERANQKFLFAAPSTWISAGLSWTRSLRQGLRENPEIETMEDVMIVELLLSENKVVGAIGINIYTGEIIQFNAKTVILGTGGFQPCSLKNTVTDMTGDGIGMAYRAGAQLSDMEFLLAFATALYPNEVKGSIYPFVMEFNMRDVDYVVLDKNHNEIEIPEEIIKISRGKKLSKLISMYYWGQAIEKGLGTKENGVYLDYSGNEKEKLKNSINNFFEKFSTWHKYGYYKGESMLEVKEKILSDGKIEVGVGYEYSMGGIVVNENMETSVEGLYAAGEVTSGVFGANRVRDGLTEMLCQGYRAGISAAEYSHKADLINIGSEEVISQIKHIVEPFSGEGSISSIEVHDEIEKICDQGFGMIRDEDKLKNALEKLEIVKNEKIPNIKFKSSSKAYNYEWIDYLQIQNLIICAEAGIKAALMRKESRGCHIRKDYPMVDNENYMHKIISEKQGKEMKLWTREPIVTRISLPTKNNDNIMSYLLDKDVDYNTKY